MITINRYSLHMLLVLATITPLYAEKKAVFIIGTGRCGSSCTAKVLNTMGLPLGDQLKPGKITNPKGYFEDVPTIELTAAMLAKMNALFSKPLFIEWDNHPDKVLFKALIKQCLHKHFSSFPFFGIKNPIIALFLPLYCQAAQELGYTPKIIIIKRDLEETYQSWHKIFKCLTRDQVIYGVDCYLKAMARYTPDYDCLEVNFDDVLHNTRHTAEKFRAFLPELQPYESVQDQINAFLDKDLKHHNNTPLSS